MSSHVSRRSSGVVVASVPAGHPYVRHIARERPGPLDPVRLADPDPDDPTRPATGRWWPSPLLDPGWWEEPVAADLLHVHFGFDHATPDQLRGLVDRLAERGVPLVQTVHDLRNPHHDDPRVHQAQLDVLLPAAARVLTLTAPAAAELRARWGVEAVVVPHPHVVPLDDLPRWAATPRPPGPFRVGVQVKGLRQNTAPELVLPVLLDAVRDDADPGVLQVDVHEDVMAGATGRARAVAALLRRLGGEPEVELRVHPGPLSDAELFASVHALDVSVLPYRFGTHSGWLEMCADLGTDVVAPLCGHYAAQGPVDSYELDEGEYDPDSLVTAVRRARERGRRPARTVAQRRAQREAVAAAHDEVYAAAVHAQPPSQASSD